MIINANAFHIPLKDKTVQTVVTSPPQWKSAFGRKDKIPNYSYSDKYISKCDNLYQKCKELNRVGL